MRGHITKLMITQSCDSLRFSGAGTLSFESRFLKPRLHLPRSSYDFSVCDFLYDFLDIVGDRGLRRMCLHMFFLICHLSTFSYKNARRSCGSRMSPQIVRRYHRDPVRCPYGVDIRFDTKRKEAAR